MLNGDDAAGGKALAVADPLDIVDDRNFRIAGQQEIGVQRVRRPRRGIEGAACGSERLADDLPAINPLPAGLRRVAAKQVELKLFEIEELQQVLDGRGHCTLFCHIRHGSQKPVGCYSWGSSGRQPWSKLQARGASTF